MAKLHASTMMYVLFTGFIIGASLNAVIIRFAMGELRDTAATVMPGALVALLNSLRNML